MLVILFLYRGVKMKITVESTDKLMEMANLRGRQVKTDNINFSFYYSDKSGVSHGIRVKIKWNPDRMSGEVDGYMELHGDYNYIDSPNSKKPRTKDILAAKKFFQKYKVLFAAVWEMKLEEDVVQDYLRKLITLEEVKAEFYDIPEVAYMQIQKCNSISDIEYVVRKTDAFNMND